MSKPKLAADEFECAVCGGVYAKARSDEEAMVDSRARYGDVAPEQLSVICDPCFEEFTKMRKTLEKLTEGGFVTKVEEA